MLTVKAQNFNVSTTSFFSEKIMARVPPLFINDESELTEQFPSAEVASAGGGRPSPFGKANPLLRYQIERKVGKSSFLVADQLNNSEL